MIYKTFKGIKLSTLGMGNMRLPEKDTDSGKVIEYDKAKEIIDYAVANGVNYFDTSYIYHNGESEAFTGKALSEYPRDSYYVADKFNFQAQPDYRIQFPEQLERLNMDHIDFYLLHGIQDNFIDDILASGCIDYFKQMKSEGRISYFGFSFHGCEESLMKMLDANPEWDFVQIQLNYYDWEYGNQQKLYRILEARNIPVMVMEPVHGGLLAKLNDSAAALLKEADPDASLASWALRWVSDLPGVQVTLSGMGDMAQIKDNINTFSEKKPLTDSDREFLKQAAAMLRPDIAMPCTGCRYCVPNCPKGLDIPRLLIAYNDLKSDSTWRLGNLFGLPKDKQPAACIGCGACTAHCPQSLPVPEAMAEMSGQMANS
jgi:hypothetical protein